MAEGGVTPSVAPDIVALIIPDLSTVLPTPDVAKVSRTTTVPGVGPGRLASAYDSYRECGNVLIVCGLLTRGTRAVVGRWGAAVHPGNLFSAITTIHSSFIAALSKVGFTVVDVTVRAMATRATGTTLGPGYTFDVGTTNKPGARTVTEPTHVFTGGLILLTAYLSPCSQPGTGGYPGSTPLALPGAATVTATGRWSQVAMGLTAGVG